MFNQINQLYNTELSSSIRVSWGKAGIQELQFCVCVTELSLQHLEKRKPADLGAW